MGISILGYRSYATLAIVADAHLVPDPETITQGFQHEYVALLSAARLPEGAPPGGRMQECSELTQAVWRQGGRSHADLILLRIRGEGRAHDHGPAAAPAKVQAHP